MVRRYFSFVIVWICYSARLPVILTSPQWYKLGSVIYFLPFRDYSVYVSKHTIHSPGSLWVELDKGKFVKDKTFEAKTELGSVSSCKYTFNSTVFSSCASPIVCARIRSVSRKWGSYKTTLTRGGSVITKISLQQIQKYEKLQYSFSQTISAQTLEKIPFSYLPLYCYLSAH